MKRFVLLAALAAFPAEAAVLGQMDTFEDGTTLGWSAGEPQSGSHPAPPVNVPTGGPAGVGDGYLRLTATGQQGPGSRLSVLSGPSWAGDYRAAGITFILMDVNNFGPAELSLRLLFEDFQGFGPPVNLALSRDAVVVPAGSGWMRVRFDVSPGALLPGVFGTVEGALASTDTLRLFHNPVAAFPGPPDGQPAVNAVLGVDNITASIPEPSTWWLLGTGLALGWLRRHRSH